MVKAHLNKLCVAVCFMGVLACSKSGPDAMTYHNNVMAAVNGNETLMVEMNNAMNAQDYKRAESVRKKWLSSVEAQISQVDTVGPYKGDAAYQQAATEALKSVHTVLAVDYPKLIAIRSGGTVDKPAENKALNAINTALEGLATKLNAASTAFESKFAQ